MPALEIEKRDSAEARVPSAPPGVALVFMRYAKEKSVVLSPEDFRRLMDLDAAIESIGKSPRLRLSPLVLLAHELEDEPSGEPLEDADAIRALFS